LKIIQDKDGNKLSFTEEGWEWQRALNKRNPFLSQRITDLKAAKESLLSKQKKMETELKEKYSNKLTFLKQKIDDTSTEILRLSIK